MRRLDDEASPDTCRYSYAVFSFEGPTLLVIVKRCFYIAEHIAGDNLQLTRRATWDLLHATL